MMQEDGILVQLYKINKYVQDVTSKTCKKMKINHVELMIILLSNNKDVSVSRLSEELGLTRSAISQALVCLQIKKLITKVPSLENKKSFYIKPTTKALEIGKEIFSAHMDEFLQIKEKLGEEKYYMFFSLVSEINKIIRKEN